MTPGVGVWRAPRRPRGEDVLAADAALAAGVVGIGDDDPRRVRRLAELPEGDFVWTRDADGLYFVGRVGAGRWVSPVGGLTHARAARWLERPFGEDDVPVAVAATFARGGRNLQRIRDPSVEAATAACWEEAAQAAGSAPGGPRISMS